MFVWDSRHARNRKNCKDTKKFSFPYRKILKNLYTEVVHARYVQEFNAWLDDNRYQDVTI